MNLNLLGPVCQTGYGIVTYNMLREMGQLGFDVALFPIGGVEYPDDAEAGLISRARAYANFYDQSAPNLRIWHQYNLAERVGTGPLTGFTFFELNRLKQGEVHHINNCDRVAVCSEWAANVIHNCGGDEGRIFVIPLGVDRNIFHEGLTESNRDIFQDYTIFVNVGKWEIRKGHDVLLSAFNKAFNKTDKAILKLAALNPFIGSMNEQWARKYLTSKLAWNFLIEKDRLPTQRHVAQYLASSDCAVFPSRAEAWNLELLESMSCGLPCITTNYSGHTEYASEANCRLIQIDEVEPAYDGVWFDGAGDWAKWGKDQEDQLINHLREVHRLKQTGGLLRNESGIETAKKLSWVNTAQLLHKVVQDGK